MYSQLCITIPVVSNRSLPVPLPAPRTPLASWDWRGKGGVTVGGKKGRSSTYRQPRSPFPILSYGPHRTVDALERKVFSVVTTPLSFRL